ncbi:MAG TPA: glycosyltransferase [Candidatus Limnocylindria bacterium]|nr:glycosyltransferase [Candidatus Limnocylindria bacterium]
MTPTTDITTVVQVHTRYQQAGGEDRVVDSERELLEAAGIRVHQVLFDNATIPDRRSFVGDAAIALGAIWSRAAVARVEAAIAEVRPELVHVHNTFAVASPAVLRAAHRAGVAVVHSLHNFRLVCPVATAFRDGRPCTDCVGRAIPWPGVIHACVRDSMSQSAVAATALVVHRALGTFRSAVDGYLALTNFQRDLLIVGGVPARRTDVVPNFVNAPAESHQPPRSGALFVGRLAEEKGVRVLVEAAERRRGTVRVIGDGPLSALVAAAAMNGVLAASGHVAPDAVSAEISSSVALVVPSIWFEGFPLVVLEAYAAGTPVIASRIGSLAEIVEHGLTGLLCEPGDSHGLADLIGWAMDHPVEMRWMGDEARRRYQETYSGPAHLSQLLAAYGRAAARHAAHG